MKEINITGQKREALGKKASKQYRKEGLVPCNIYGEKKCENGRPVAMSFVAPMSELRKLVYTPHIYVVNLIIDGESHPAIMKELQFHPVTDALLHIDFYEVNDQKPIVMGVPVKLQGLAAGVRAGGRMNLSIRKINVLAPYQQIPEHLDIDVTKLGLGKSIKVGELSFEGLELVTPKEVVVCSVKATRNSAAAAAAAAEETAVAAETALAGDSMHHIMMQKFLEGGWEWMLPVLLCLVIGLAVAIERILYLSLATINSKKLIAAVEDALKNGGIEAAKEVCRNTRGPIASIYYQGLDRYDQGLDAVEKAVVSYGSVQTGQMESGLSWIGLFIALSPMLGFMGTVVGMIAAFDAIQAAGDISPTLVAGGIKVALLTTLMGLIAAVVLQLFYNYIVSKIDSLVNDMEDSSITLMDILTAYNKK